VIVEMILEKQIECRLAGETEVLGETCPRGTFIFLILVCEAIGTAATPAILCQPRVIVEMIVEKQMECRLAGETEVLGENLPQRHRDAAVANQRLTRLSYGEAVDSELILKL
jgi:hypothetical protein